MNGGTDMETSIATKRILTPAQRLIVDADFRPPNPKASYRREWVRREVLRLANSLVGTGVCLKLNSALRAWGYDLIREIHSRGLGVFADFKFADIGETLSIDGNLLYEYQPEIVTVFSTAGVASMKALKAELPDTEVLCVTVLTSLDEEECASIFKYGMIFQNVGSLALMADEAGMDGIVCSPVEAGFVVSVVRPEMTINTPAIRPAWAIVPGDDQNPERIMTPAKAIALGADRIIVGRPIVMAEKPYDAVMRTIDEIASAMA